MKEETHTMNAAVIPDLILHNGHITTLDPKNREAFLKDPRGYLRKHGIDLPPEAIPPRKQLEELLAQHLPPKPPGVLPRPVSATNAVAVCAVVV